MFLQGCANAYLTMHDDTIVHYYMGDSYSPDSYSGIRYNDPMFSIEWPCDPKIISEKDLNFPDYLGKGNLRVAITGASGFLGRPLSEKLSILGIEVLAIARSIPNDISKNKIYWLKADLSIPESYQTEVKLFSPEVVIHLAWQDIPDFSLEKSKVNLHQSLDFINFIVSLQSCKKILFSGSCWEYDNASGVCIETEKVEGLKNHFTWAKNSLRKKAELLCKQKSLSFVWFRIFYIYGPGQRLGSLLPSIFINLKEGKLPQINSPFNSNDYIYIDDVVDAFTVASTSSFPSGVI